MPPWCKSSVIMNVFFSNFNKRSIINLRALYRAFSGSTADTDSRSFSSRNKMSIQEKSKASRIVWMDLEMTGLDINKDQILEIACLVTDADLNIIAEGPDLIIHHSEDTLKNMDQWCIAQHGESGLTEASIKSNLTVKEAENQILKFISSHVPKNKCPIAGNSVYMDKLFLRKYMPDLDAYMHYRLIDVSTIKELAKRWYPRLYSDAPLKKFKHRSLDDIKDSVEELKYYKENVFHHQ